MPVQPERESVETYEWYGEWLVLKSERSQLQWVIDTPPPRPFGVVKQLRVELSSPKAIFVYALGFAWVIAGAVARVGWVFLFGVVFIAFFARGFPVVLRTWRRGVLATTRVSCVEFDFAGNRGVTKDLHVGGRTMNVGFESDIVSELIALHGSAELLVIYDPELANTVAHAIAYRPPRAP